MPNRTPIDVRFWRMVEKTEGCWIWTGNRSKAGKGYGQISLKGRLLAAHRVSWEIHSGPIGPGLVVCHRCDNPACVRPDHLFLGTESDNMRDCASKQRIGNQILSDADVIAIRKSKEQTSLLAKRLGVRPSTVRSIRNGRQPFRKVIDTGAAS